MTTLIALFLLFEGLTFTLLLPRSRKSWAVLAAQSDASLNRFGFVTLLLSLVVALYGALGS